MTRRCPPYDSTFCSTSQLATLHLADAAHVQAYGRPLPAPSRIALVDPVPGVRDPVTLRLASDPSMSTEFATKLREATVASRRWFAYRLHLDRPRLPPHTSERFFDFPPCPRPLHLRRGAVAR